MIENLVRQDDIKVEVGNFCAAMYTLIDQDDTAFSCKILFLKWTPDLEN